ncbi:MAG TPA: hypothetical protein VF607_03565, partial [Verrucomicrobiae bacterium]
MFLYLNIPQNNRDNGWATIVMHNWHEYGYQALHGQLVANPGGLAEGEKPFIYPRHRPTFLTIPYVLKELPGAAAGDGALYDGVILALLFGSVLWLMGTHTRGLLTASVLCLAPGVMSNLINVDTISTPALLGIAVMCFVAGTINRPTAANGLKAITGLILVVYMALNWSSLFSLTVLAAYLLVRQTDWKKPAIYILPAGVIGVLILAISLHGSPASGSITGAPPPPKSDMWNAYLWGPEGYDHQGMTFAKAFVRIMAVNVIAWAPLGLVALILWRLQGPGPRAWRAGLPLLTGIGMVFAMRNYNAHHPWGAISMIGLGVVLSLELLIRPEPQPLSRLGKWTVMGTGLGAGILLAFWLAANSYNNRNALPLFNLVAQHTERDALIVLAGGLLPDTNLPDDLTPFADEFDRHLVSLTTWQKNPPTKTTTAAKTYVLAHEPLDLPGLRPVATSEVASSWSDRWLAPLFDFYRQKISRRAAGNRKV